MMCVIASFAILMLPLQSMKAADATVSAQFALRYQDCVYSASRPTLGQLPPVLIDSSPTRRLRKQQLGASMASLASRLPRWRRRFIAVGGFKKQSSPFGSLLTDRAITTALIDWLDEYLSRKPTGGNKSKDKHPPLTVEIFRAHVNRTYAEELSMLKRGGPKGKDGKKAISTETARKWLQTLGYCVNGRSIISYAGVHTFSI
jgi:hypothetical protein